MNGLRDEWGEQLLILQVNSNLKKNRSLVEEFEGQLTPTFILFDEAGQEVWRHTGPLNPAEVRRQANAMFKHNSEAAAASKT